MLHATNWFGQETRPLINYFENIVEKLNASNSDLFSQNIESENTAVKNNLEESLNKEQIDLEIETSLSPVVYSLSDDKKNNHTLVLDDVVRVYFSCRPENDKNGFAKSYTTFLDLDKKFIFYFDSNGAKTPKQIKVRKMKRLHRKMKENKFNKK